MLDAHHQHRPYGDAIVHEMIPYIEKLYRGVGSGWARTVLGSMCIGGLAHQVLED
jgi:hypothetical protein